MRDEGWGTTGTRDDRDVDGEGTDVLGGISHA